MNIFRLAIELFALYLLYKLIFDFIIPVARTTKQVKSQFNEMNARMQQMNEQQQARSTAQQQTTTSSKVNPSKGSDDYIEFEEVK
ncbi:MAG: hypothetical protein RLY16_1005 [Bacteroidota bacterium]|jgi:Sec-independent protein translocase protein TatA